jgi:hypothetical protein
MRAWRREQDKKAKVGERKAAGKRKANGATGSSADQGVRISTGLEGMGELAKTCEAEIVRLEKELAEAGTDEERSQRSAALEQARAGFAALKKEFGVE